MDTLTAAREYFHSRKNHAYDCPVLMAAFADKQAEGLRAEVERLRTALEPLAKCTVNWLDIEHANTCAEHRSVKKAWDFPLCNGCVVAAALEGNAVAKEMSQPSETQEGE